MKNEIKIAFILHPLSVSEFKGKRFFYAPFELPIGLILKILPSELIKKIYSSLPPHVFMSVGGIESRIKSKVSVLGIMCPLFPVEIIATQEKAFKNIRQGRENKDTTRNTCRIANSSAALA